ncbi:hypothetical protein ABK040_003011 [Willaertia magna]
MQKNSFLFATSFPTHHSVLIKSDKTKWQEWTFPPNCKTIKGLAGGAYFSAFYNVDKNDQIFNVIFDNVVKLDSKEITTTIKCIGCSDNSFILVTIDNKMFGYGNNQFNVQLGIYSTDKFNYIITPFEKESEIMDVKCGYYHTVVLLKNGTFYVCGYNNLGQTNVYNQVNVPRFTKLTHPLFENEFITKIYCSSRGTVLITKNYNTAYFIGEVIYVLKEYDCNHKNNKINTILNENIKNYKVNDNSI